MVMERGSTVEQGAHAELLRHKGASAGLWLSQQWMDQDAGGPAAQ